MIYSTVDQIVRKGLLENSLPIHWYSELLFHTSSGIQELSFDTLKIINTVYLPIGTYGEIDLPADFVDELGVSFQAGGLLQEIPKNYDINPMRTHNATTGAFTNYPDVDLSEDQQDNLFFWGTAGWLFYWNVNGYGEPTGRFFGAPGGTQIGYSVERQRRQIQLTGGFVEGGVVLMYISDGQSIESATQVDVRAIRCIRAWQEWKRSPNANNENSPEGRQYHNQKRTLRARLDDLTSVDILNIVRNAYRGTIKN